MEKIKKDEGTRQEEILAKKIIDELLDRSDDLSIALHYGEPCLLLSDVINIINNIAETSYKRYGSGNFGYEHWDPYTIDQKCEVCKKYFARYPKNEHRIHCNGKDKPSSCKDYESTL